MNTYCIIKLKAVDKNKEQKEDGMKKNKGFLNYNTLKGRLIFALVFGLAIVIGFSIINSEVLKPDGLESDLRQMDQFLNSMSILLLFMGLPLLFMQPWAPTMG